MIARLTALATLAACSSRMHGSQPELPPAPVLGAQIERVGRPLIGNALLGLLAPADIGERRKEQYNRATPAAGAAFVADFEASLALYDGYDGVCGNQWLAGRNAAPAQRYHTLATLFADDRLWLDSRVARCTQYLAVERGVLDAAAQPDDAPPDDCGGRAPTVDANNAFRNLVVRGAATGDGDGVHVDDHPPSTTVFPFLVAP